MPREEKRLVSAGFLTADPRYHSAKAFRDVLRVIMSHENYAPEWVAGGDHKVERRQFGPDLVASLPGEWERTHPLWDMLRFRHADVTITLLKSTSHFEPLLVNVEREFLTATDNLAEFIMLLKDLYGVVHPAYGEAHVEEMKEVHDSPSGRKLSIGFDLKRALPDIYWANFLGPEYVNMFGVDKVLSSPVYSAERLPDGGALLLLTKSPLDYLSERRQFEKRRTEAKNHLGLEAFDTGDISHKGKVPIFRFLEEKERLRQQRFTRRRESSESKDDLLSTVRREEWREWIARNRSLALEFAQELAAEGFKLDFSPKSLQSVDDYVERLRASKATTNIEFLKKLSAYAAQVVVRETGASFSFDESEDIPFLRVGKLQVSPLARAQKAILEGEKFEPWYRYLVEELKSNPDSKSRSGIR